MSAGATKSLDEIHGKRDNTRIKAVPDFRSRSGVPFPGERIREFLESGQIDITRDEYFDFNSPSLVICIFYFANAKIE